MLLFCHDYNVGSIFDISGCAQTNFSRFNLAVPSTDINPPLNSPQGDYQRVTVVKYFL